MTLSKTGQDPTKRGQKRVSASLRDEGGKMFNPVDHMMRFHSTGISIIYYILKYIRLRGLSIL